MATMCVTPAVFTATEPDPTAQAFAEILAGWERLTEKNKARALPFLKIAIDHRLAEQGDPAAVAAQEAADNKHAEWWAAELAKKSKERAKMAGKIANVERAFHCAYWQVQDAVKGTENEAAFEAANTLKIYLDSLKKPGPWGFSHIRGMKTYFEKLTKTWLAKADAAKAAKAAKAVGQQ